MRFSVRLILILVMLCIYDDCELKLYPELTHCSEVEMNMRHSAIFTLAETRRINDKIKDEDGDDRTDNDHVELKCVKVSPSEVRCKHGNIYEYRIKLSSPEMNQTAVEQLIRTIYRKVEPERPRGGQYYRLVAHKGVSAAARVTPVVFVLPAPGSIDQTTEAPSYKVCDTWYQASTMQSVNKVDSSIVLECIPNHFGPVLPCAPVTAVCDDKKKPQPVIYSCRWQGKRQALLPLNDSEMPTKQNTLTAAKTQNGDFNILIMDNKIVGPIYENQKSHASDSYIAQSHDEVQTLVKLSPQMPPREMATVAKIAEPTWRGLVYLSPQKLYGAQIAPADVKPDVGPRLSLTPINSFHKDGTAQKRYIRSVKDTDSRYSKQISQ